MKKLLFFLSLIALASCAEKNPVNESVISGTVMNSPTQFIILSQQRDMDTISLNQDGTFSFIKQLDKAGNYYLQANKSYAILYLEPGKNIEVSFDATDLDGTLIFSGDLALENTYSQEINKLNSDISKGGRDKFLLEPAEYLTATMEDRNSREQMLKKFMAENPELGETFANAEMLNYEFSYFSSLLSYEPAHLYYAKVEEVDLPEDWYLFLDNIDINNSEYLNIPACLNVITSVINKKIEEASKLGDDAWGTAELLGAQFDWILENVTSADVADYFLNSYVTSIVDYAGPTGIESYVETYYEKASNEKAKSELAAKVDEWAPLTPGNEAPPFMLPDINGNQVSLSDFAGKYVYIDFWATWCGPCKIEIPVLIELAEKYKEKNIEIISISVDQDKQAWIDMVTADKPGWLQLHDGVNMNDEYLVKFIPTFVLIDRDGKILNPRAPRPSSGEELTNLFDSLEGI